MIWSATQDSGLEGEVGAGHPLTMDPLRRLSPAQRFALARELRCAPTPAERYTWRLLRNRGVLGLKFRRQHVLHGFVVDFYCIAERLVVELEGDAHDDRAQRSYDRARADFLRAGGYRIVRMRNQEVTREHLERVLREALETTRATPPSVPPLQNGEGARG
jgi:very-short-patch-repair endonuclease